MLIQYFLVLRYLCAIALLATFCAALRSSSAQTATLLFEDDFDGTTLDTSKWTIGYHDPDTGDVVPGAVDQFLLNNNYAGYITEEDVQVNNGSLHLLNQKRRYRGDNRQWYDYTSGQVMTLHKFSLNKGYIEWRAQFPSGDSMWPALWLIAEDLVWGPEWDAFEYFGTRQSLNATDVMGMHLMTGEHPNTTWHSHWEYNFDSNYDNEAWHKYGFEWTATEANWYIDDLLVHTLPNTMGSAWPNEQMYIVMNNGILASQTPADPADFPNSLTIDYVRAWDQKPTAGLSGDFNLDGSVDGLDFLLWQHDSSAGLLSDWEANYGLALGQPRSASIPEPGTLLLALVGLSLGSRGWSRLALAYTLVA